MRILITGANGQVGSALQRALSHEDVIALSHTQLDITDAGAVLATLRDTAPACVIHCAALTDTSACEHDPARAEAINAVGTGNLARVCAQQDRWLIALSTNEVFDGQSAAPYSEDAPPGPLNAYGRSKLNGERLAAAMQSDAVIVRTSWVFGEGGSKSFVDKVVEALKAGRPLRFVSDEVSAPTSADDLAAAIRLLIERNAAAGVYHLANAGQASRYDWAREIAELADIDVQIGPVTTSELREGGYDGPKKPPYSVLGNNRARAIGVTLRPWQDALAAHFDRARIAADG